MTQEIRKFLKADRTELANLSLIACNTLYTSRAPMTKRIKSGTTHGYLSDYLDVFILGKTNGLRFELGFDSDYNTVFIEAFKTLAFLTIKRVKIVLGAIDKKEQFEDVWSNDENILRDNAWYLTGRLLTLIEDCKLVISQTPSLAMQIKDRLTSLAEVL